MAPFISKTLQRVALAIPSLPLKWSPLTHSFSTAIAAVSSILNLIHSESLLTSSFQPKVPRQPGSNECGYYVMHFIRDIMEDINVLHNNFNGKEVYLQSEIDEVRDE